MEEKRICNKCGQEKPLTEKYFHFRKDSNKFRNDCIECKSQSQQNYYQNHKQEKKDYNKIFHNNNPNYSKDYNIKIGWSTGNIQTIPEKQIELFLIQNNIKYQKEKTFNDCRNERGSLLSFDFYLPDLNIIIEYDGIFHFKPIFPEAFDKIQKHDQIKNTYCLIKGIRLIRISYIDNLQDCLIKISKYEFA